MLEDGAVQREMLEEEVVKLVVTVPNFHWFPQKMREKGFSKSDFERCSLRCVLY